MIHKLQKVLLTFCGKPVSRFTFESCVGAVKRKLSDLAGRSLLKRLLDSKPALISVIFSFLLHLREVRYGWLFEKQKRRENCQSRSE